MRKVKVFNWKKKTKRSKESTKQFVGNGFLLGFGTDFVELEKGVGQYTAALVEMDDLSLQCIYPSNIAFITPAEEEDEIDYSDGDEWKRNV